MFLFVVLSPIVMIFMRNRRKVLAWMLAAMWFAYVIYETGISMGSNIRVDLVIILPALALGSILSFWWLTRD
ncbi:MAG: hypothetical protein EHM43_10150 [Ignavibacteriae bacterium]|nr:MAG: hypothetical protein EHM43_10150 [Ignavibacteriota bacterium]